MREKQEELDEKGIEQKTKDEELKRRSRELACDPWSSHEAG